MEQAMPDSPRSRRVVVISTVLLLIAFDAARSVIGHVGYQTPVSMWHPDPEVYADMSWPPSSNVPANAAPAQRVYLEKCGFCHGPDGRGNGTSAPSMIPRPRDFTRGQFKYKTTPADAPPSDDDLIRVATEGLHASGMPYFRGILSEVEIRGVVAYLKGFSTVFAAGTAVPIEVPPRPPATPESVVRGAALYAQSGCAGCHGDDLRGGQVLEDAKGYPVISRDLTAPWTFRGGDAPEQVFLRVSTGMAPGPMPAYAELPAEGRWDLVNFLESRGRTPPWQAGGVLDGPGQAPDLESRGRYLVHAEMCGLCHTELDPAMVYRDDRYLAGGMRVGAYPQGTFITRNLTSDSDTGLGRWSEAEIATAIRDGRTKDGRLLNFWGMPWPWLHNLSSDDAVAIARYLKTLPPIHNDIVLPLHYGVIETIAVKLWKRGPLLSGWPVLTYTVGSYANLPPPGMASIASLLATAQWLALFVGLMLFAVACRRSLLRSVGGWMRMTAVFAAGVIVFAVGYFIDATPAVPVLPPDKVAEAVTDSIPRPDVSNLSPTRAGLVQRGRYIFANASCAYCHNNDGSGGLKVSGPFGTIFTSNISPDKDAGLGAWTDAEIARAVRSGVSRSGRLLFWQGMPWDHFSNWDEEDVVSLIAYLRAMPPAGEKVPPYRPPAPDDCKIYTFWTFRNLEPGCR
jgi:mono/diheme cytochrome c family protein